MWTVSLAAPSPKRKRLHPEWNGDYRHISKNVDIYFLVTICLKGLDVSIFFGVLKFPQKGHLTCPFFEVFIARLNFFLSKSYGTLCNDYTNS